MYILILVFDTLMIINIYHFLIVTIPPRAWSEARGGGAGPGARPAARVGGSGAARRGAVGESSRSDLGRVKRPIYAHGFVSHQPFLA